MKADFEIKRLEGRRRWKRRAAYAVRVTAGSDAAAAAFARRLAFGGLNGRRVLGRLRPRDQLPQTGLRGRQRAPEPRPRAGGAGVRPEDSSPPSLARTPIPAEQGHASGPASPADIPTPGGARVWSRHSVRGRPGGPGQRNAPEEGRQGRAGGCPQAPRPPLQPAGGQQCAKLGRSALRPRPAPLGPGGPRRGETAQGWPAPAEPSWKGAGRWSQRRDAREEGGESSQRRNEGSRAGRALGGRPCGEGLSDAHTEPPASAPRASCRPGKARLRGPHAARQRVSRSRRDDPVEAGLSSVSGRLGRAEPGDRP